ncbi:hypothetical protein D3C87_1314120 [compost metagenome]
MNAKKCKALRKIARTMRHPLSGGYLVTRHRERVVPTGQLTADGKQQVVRYTPVTIRNDAGGLRGAYRELKKAAAK